MTYRLYNADMLNRYAKDCHQRAVAKGFWAEKHTYYHYLMLAYGELHEAIEADRLGKWAKIDHDTIDNAPAYRWCALCSRVPPPC